MFRFFINLTLVMTLNSVSLLATEEYPPPSPSYTEDQIRGSKDLLDKVMKTFPPESSIVIFSGPLSAIHSIVARRVLGDKYPGYMLYHPLQDFHESSKAASNAYFKMLVQMSRVNHKKIVLLRQLDEGGVITHMSLAIAALTIPNIKSHIVLAGVHSTHTLNWNFSTRIQKTNHDQAMFKPDFIEFFQVEFVDYSLEGDYNSLVHPANYTKELIISYDEWFSDYGMKIPLRQPDCRNVW